MAALDAEQRLINITNKVLTADSLHGLIYAATDSQDIADKVYNEWVNARLDAGLSKDGPVAIDSLGIASLFSKVNLDK